MATTPRCSSRSALALIALAALLLAGCGSTKSSGSSANDDFFARQAAAHRQADASGGSGEFTALEDELGGEIGAPIGPPGSTKAESFGNRLGLVDEQGADPLRLLQDVGGPSGLGTGQAEEMRRALTLSDNEAAAALFADLERRHGGLAGTSAAVGEVLREAGDGSTQIS